MEYLLLVIVGLAAGLLGGLLGIGGSVVMIPAMVILLGSGEPGSNIQQYQAAAMLVNFLLIGPAVLRHRKAGAIVRDVWIWLIPAALLGIVLGVIVSRVEAFTGENTIVMKRVFGAFLLYVAGYNVWKLRASAPKSERPPGQQSRQPAWKKLAVGLPMGFSAGLLGIGGGALAVPALQLVIRLPLRNAIATSAATILGIAWLGAIVKNVAIHGSADGTVLRSLLLAVCLAPTAMIGSSLGGHLTHALPLKVVRVAFILLMIVAGVRMLELGRLLGWA
jgi:hypothetical protein